jgi:hypothetical protein
MIVILPTGQPLFADEDAILHTMIDGVDINLWIPDGVKTLRGVWVDPANAQVGGDPKDPSSAVWEETCRNLDCGRVGMILQDMNRNNRPTILQKALLAALKEFAAKSGHPELEQMPLCFSGMIRVQAKTVNGESRQPKTKVNRAVPVSRALRAYLDRYAPAVVRRVLLPQPQGQPLRRGQLHPGPPRRQPEGRAALDLPDLPPHVRKPTRDGGRKPLQDRHPQGEQPGDVPQALCRPCARNSA